MVALRRSKSLYLTMRFVGEMVLLWIWDAIGWTVFSQDLGTTSAKMRPSGMTRMSFSARALVIMRATSLVRMGGVKSSEKVASGNPGAMMGVRSELVEYWVIIPRTERFFR